ncbi:MAG: DUF3592 domain-containing protein [Clostridia bacterium]|nr:DUF3592 domain-containing protein [Clostridia bacterium]
MKRFTPLLVGVVMLAAGIFLLVRQNALSKVCTAPANAAVVDFKEELGTDTEGVSSYTYYPIVEFAVGDRTLQVTLDKGEGTPAYDVGEQLDILYDPSNPERVILKGDKSSNVLGLIFSVLGGLVTVFGLYVAFKPTPKPEAPEAR